MRKGKQQIHEELVKEINRIYGREKFTIKKKATSPYDTNNNLSFSNEIIAVGALITDVINFTGGSIGDVDLYQLLQKYLLNEEARIQINQILKST